MQRHQSRKAPSALSAFFGAIISAPLRWTSRSANALLALGGLIGLPFILQSSPPAEHYPPDRLNPPVGRTLVLLDADGQPFARRGGCVDKPVRFSDLPPHFVSALLSMEDRRFFSHFGIDPIGISRAAYRNWHAGMILEGGSTITQQLVKFSYLSNLRTMARKQKEASLAMWLELILSKQEILERYLSSVYFGEGCFGLRAAAKHYFEKPVRALTLSESAFLVGLLKAPNLTLDLEAAQERAALVLQSMVENGRLTKSRLAKIPPAMPRARPVNHFGAHYADWLASTMHSPNNGDYSPLPVQTAFQPELQRIAEQAIASVLDKQGKTHDASEAALVAMRTDGRVVAMVGGRSYAKSQFNRAVQALRQPGSSFKLFVYLAALRAGIRPDSVVVDEPISIGEYEPENFGKGYRGAVSIRSAFASSINTVAVRLSEATGRNRVIKVARDLGISTPLEPVPSIALGSFEVKLLDLTSAYAAVAAGAYPVKPWGILRLGNSSATPQPPQGAGLWRLTVKEDIRELLRGTVLYGSGRRAQLSISAYGKTGTSQDYRDAWFLGFAGNLVVGVWVGNDDFSPMRRVTGGSLPAQIWRSFMKEAIRSDPEFERKLPEIAAFEARTPVLQVSASSEAALAELESDSDQGRKSASKSSSNRGSSKRQRVRRADRGSSHQPQLVGKADDGSSKRRSSSSGSRPAAQASESFQRQLSDIKGWPTTN